MTENLYNDVNWLASLMRTVVELDDTNVAFTLLRSWANVSLFTYLLHTTPHQLTSEAAAKIHNQMISFIRDFSGCSIQENAQDILHPIRSKTASLRS